MLPNVGNWTLGVGRSSARAVMIAAACLALAGCRQDMHDAPSYDPLQQTSFFANGAASRPLVANTVARGHLRDDEHLYTGKINGQTATEFPMPVTKAVLDRGQERFNVYCAPCHGRTGRGRRDDRAARLPCAAVVPRGAAAQRAGRLPLRRDDERFRRDAGLFGAGHRARSLGHRGVHPCAAAQSVRDRRTMCRRIAAAISIGLRKPRRTRTGEPATVNTTYAPPAADIDVPRSRALIVAVIGLVGCAIGFFVNAEQFYRSWLIAYLLFLGITLGSMAFVMIQHLSGGAWGVFRRIFEASSRTILLLAVLFIPVLIGMTSLYPWTQRRAPAERRGRSATRRRISTCRSSLRAWSSTLPCGRASRIC